MTFSTLVVLVCIGCLFQISAASNEVVLSDFTTADPALKMITINDPVMGGRSESTVELQDNCCLVWEGEVNIVDFLDSPGFCILENEPTPSMPKLSDTSGISFWVHPNTEFMQLSAAVQTDVKMYGFHIQYEAILEVSEGGGLMELHAPWTSFRPTLMGQDVDAPKLEGDELDKIQVVGLSTYQSHKAGKFRVELVKIVANGLEVDQWLNKARNLRELLSLSTSLRH